MSGWQTLTTGVSRTKLAATMILQPERVQNLFRNPIFLSALSSLVVAQFIKMMLALTKAKRRDARDILGIFLWRTGGMPSSHSAIAVAISSSIALTEGFSNLFILSLFLSLIVIRDALGVRRSSGLQSTELNKLGVFLEKKFGIDYDPVREVHGHTFAEVCVGGFLGFLISLSFCL